ncbi:family 43 glycosylhydrolase [Reichenbachiella carrageenanivorans]|uniref:Family 43 glycosylhydrolase n=1 Tax=Reichenbachiella carrageenanivorans TaxID=2979869 RepID=A0ABY6CX08_9BACT|nr:family 43 glycosylhydrolase [Reichenbachiella carrageenanivorans]UXX77869.1 family 43 glycosylhydrolase [Reichenbachiella carrageenanivorans]
MKSYKNPLRCGNGLVALGMCLLFACQPPKKEGAPLENDTTGFPWDIPQTRPDRPLSEAMDRLYSDYRTPRPEDNELYSSFAYTPLEGFDYHDGDGTVSRRDPSKVIFENGQYYVWYTKRDTQTPPVGWGNADQSTEVIPSTDWDLAEIWYATSKDGFRWEERGVAVSRPDKPAVGWRSVSTPDVLKFGGKYYLYYQGFMEASGKKGDHCPVTASYADSPDGPWTPVGKIVVENGEPGTWDQYSIHDPYPLVYKGKIYLYYKAAFGDRPDYLVANGLAIADNPLGPFEKHPLNPVLNSSHETAYFPFEEGIATLVTRNGNESNTIQYAPDGVNFKIAAVSALLPLAAGPYVPDAFDSQANGRGITWGLCHFTNYGNDWGKDYSVLARFDCDLSLDLDDKKLKQTQTKLRPEVYFSKELTKEQKVARQSIRP